MSANDRHQLKKMSKKAPAMGHSFGPDLVCACGRTSDEHQARPDLCSLLVKLVSDFDLAIANTKRASEDKIKGLQATVAMLERRNLAVRGELKKAHGRIDALSSGRR